MNFHKIWIKMQKFSLKTCIRKCCLQNDSHVEQNSLCWHRELGCLRTHFPDVKLWKLCVPSKLHRISFTFSMISPEKRNTESWELESVLPKNFHGSSDICPMGLIYSIQNCEISHQTFGPSHQKCPTCPMIFVNTVRIIQIFFAFNTMRHCGLVTPHGDRDLSQPSHYLNQCWLIISEVQWHSY